MAKVNLVVRIKSHNSGLLFSAKVNLVNAAKYDFETVDEFYGQTSNC